MRSQIKLVRGEALPAGHDFMVISHAEGLAVFLREGASLSTLDDACAASDVLASVSA